MRLRRALSMCRHARWSHKVNPVAPRNTIEDCQPPKRSITKNKKSVATPIQQLLNRGWLIVSTTLPMSHPHTKPIPAPPSKAIVIVGQLLYEMLGRNPSIMRLSIMLGSEKPERSADELHGRKHASSNKYELAVRSTGEKLLRSESLVNESKTMKIYLCARSVSRQLLTVICCLNILCQRQVFATLPAGFLQR